jgi:hypothetical protein
MISSQTTRLLTLTPEERYMSVIQYQPFIVQRAVYDCLFYRHYTRTLKQVKKEDDRQNKLNGILNGTVKSDKYVSFQASLFFLYSGLMFAITPHY